MLLDRLVAVDRDLATLEAFARFDVEFTEGHFPGGPVVPGVALLEAMAQGMGCLAAMLEPSPRGTPLLAAFDRVRFHAPVVPPADVRILVAIRERRLDLTVAVGQAFHDGVVVCTARMTGGFSVGER